MRLLALVSARAVTSFALATCLIVPGCADSLPFSMSDESENDVGNGVPSSAPAESAVGAGAAVSTGEEAAEEDAARRVGYVDAAIPAPVADAGRGDPPSDSGTTQSACPVPLANAPIADKILKPHLLQASPGPHRVSIMLVRSADFSESVQVVCNSNSRSCPEREAAAAKQWAEHRELQRCLRGWISEVGANADGYVGTLVNVVFASVTWEQAQRIAAHPDVRDISPEEYYPPP